jgi:hypothetical protein
MPLELKTPRAILIEYEMKFHICKGSKKLSSFGSSNSLTIEEKSQKSSVGNYFSVPLALSRSLARPTTQAQ